MSHLPASAMGDGPQRIESDFYYSRQLALFGSNFKSDTTVSGSKIDQIQLHTVDNICTKQTIMYENIYKRARIAAAPETGMAHGKKVLVDYKMSYSRFVNNDNVVLFDNIRSKKNNSGTGQAFLLAGPRQQIPWAEGEVRAAIVTCGGLCPGLNNVIQELVFSLYYNYGVDVIYGIQAGYRGFYQSTYQPWTRLTPQSVFSIHEQGGSILGSSRGGFDVKKIVNACEVYGINQLYIVGGDGTHRGGNEILKEVKRRNLKFCMALVPKTIDNDIGIIDRSFGFNTSVQEARKAIEDVVVEAKCTPNGIGIVKLMGRHAGYISAQATLASRNVDLCLIPEVAFHLFGKNGIMKHIDRVLKNQGFCVIVIAEGAGGDLIQADIKATDQSGNKVLPDVGKWLQEVLKNYYKSKKEEVSIKYVDPSYMIRSVKADADDAVFSLFLASHAVHGAMAGYTGFSTGMITGRTAYIPSHVICQASPSFLNPAGSTWERVISMTSQPNYGHPEVTVVKDQEDEQLEKSVAIPKALVDTDEAEVTLKMPSEIQLEEEDLLIQRKSKL